jgi:chromosome segregation ATPase
MAMSTNTEEVVVSAKLSDLNLDQLGQVFRMVERQQEEIVQQNQALGQQIDQLREQRSKLQARVAKFSADLNALGKLINQRHQEQEDPRALPAGLPASVGELLQIDGVAPGVVLEAKRT